MTRNVHDRDGRPDPEDRYDFDDRDDYDRCEYCDRPFARERALALHRGLDHPEALSGADADAFEAAREAEAEELRRFRLKALGVLVLLYFVLLMVYALV